MAPEQDGRGALRELLAARPQTPVVLCSALGQEASALEPIETGAKDLVVEPFQPERVPDAVARALP